MKKILYCVKQNQLFFSSLVILFVAGIFFLVANGKAGSFLLLNSFHCFWLNTFFINYTLLGNGIFAIVLALYFFSLKKRKLAITIFVSFLSSGIIVQIIKHLLYSPRPKLFFGDSHASFFIQNISFCYNNSFPSGHTTTAFTVATVLALNMQNKKFQILVLFAAVLVGFSRIYTGQHFLLDILAGAIVGIISAVICSLIVQHYNFDWRSSRRKDFTDIQMSN